ncbi:MAG: ATP synthase subunit I [Gammaproteobacteria bacterium]|nr:ATP synthase subunit I [Gammaproteobacteria bacterium]
MTIDVSGQLAFYRQFVFRIVAAQVVCGLAIVLGMLVFKGAHAAYSALVGAAIGVIPSFYLARRMFRPSAEPSARGAVRNIYMAESLKILLTVALFVIALLALKVDFLVVVLTYIAIMAVHWLALLFPEHRPRPAAK